MLPIRGKPLVEFGFHSAVANYLKQDAQPHRADHLHVTRPHFWLSGPADLDEPASLALDKINKARRLVLRDLVRIVEANGEGMTQNNRYLSKGPFVPHPTSMGLVDKKNCTFLDRTTQKIRA